MSLNYSLLFSAVLNNIDFSYLNRLNDMNLIEVLIYYKKKKTLRILLYVINCFKL